MDTTTITAILATYGFETRWDGSMFWGVGSLVWGHTAIVEALGHDLPFPSFPEFQVAVKPIADVLSRVCHAGSHAEYERVWTVPERCAPRLRVDSDDVPRYGEPLASAVARLVGGIDCCEVAD